MSFTFEKSIIGCLLLDGTAHTKHDIKPEWFRADVTRNIFKSFYNDDRTNPNIIARSFNEDLIAEIVSEACMPDTLSDNLKELRRVFISQKAVEVLAKGVSDVRMGGSVESVIESLMQVCDDPEGSDRTRDLAAIMLDRFRYIEKVQTGEIEQADYLMTGYYDFDRRIGGYIKGDLTVIGGRPSMGKTSLALGSALYQANRGKRVLWFNMDSSEASIANRSFAATGAKLENIRFGKPNADDWSRMASANNIDAGRFLVDSTPGLTCTKLCNIARRADRREKLDVIYVDYLQQLSGDDEEYHRVTKASADLKRLANELGCAVVPLVQLSRELEKRSDKRPLLSDLRSSGQIEQDAYMVLYPYRPEVYAKDENEKSVLSGLVELLVRKHKDGPIGIMEESLIFDADSARFVNKEAANG